MYKDFLGEKVIVRGDRSGVFYGTLEKVKGSKVRLSDCRRIWYWAGAASISQLAVDGTKKPDKCKFTVQVDSIVIIDAIEVIKCSETSIESIEAVGEWSV